MVRNEKKVGKALHQVNDFVFCSVYGKGNRRNMVHRSAYKNIKETNDYTSKESRPLDCRRTILLLLWLWLLHWNKTIVVLQQMYYIFFIGTRYYLFRFEISIVEIVCHRLVRDCSFRVKLQQNDIIRVAMFWFSQYYYDNLITAWTSTNYIGTLTKH